MHTGHVIPLSLALVALSAEATLIGKTDRDAISYKVGEEMIFTIRLCDDPKIPDGAYLKWETAGDDGVREQGRAAVPGKDGMAIRTRLTKPGFTRVTAEIVGADGKSLDPQQLFDGGAAAEPAKMKGCNAPADKDFKAFWKRQRQRLAAVKMTVREAEAKSANPENRVSIVEIACAGPRPVTGELSVPVKPGKYPALLEVDGYGFYFPSVERRDPIWKPSGKIVLHINAHGFKMPEFGADMAYYDAFKASRKDYAFEKPADDPEKLYWNGMALRVMRALEYLKSLPTWDGKNLEVAGGSQGGLQTMWAAALEPAVTHATPHVVWCCDLAGRETLGRMGGWRPDWTPARAFYDPVNMAKWVRKDCTVDITRVGLGDYIAPPGSITVLYNTLRCPKSIRYVQGANHYVDPPKPYVEEFRSSLVEKLWLKGEKGRLSTLVTRPRDGKRHPCVVICHGFGGTKDEKGGMLKAISDRLAEHVIASVRFDFYGQGESDGKMREMTIPMEIADAKRVVAWVKQQPWADPKRVSLLGHSQGGVVASMAAGEIGTKGLEKVMLLAPACVLKDAAKTGWGRGPNFDPENPPEEIHLWGNSVVGAEYVRTAYKLPIYETAKRFEGPVLLLHGTGDKIAPKLSSEIFHKEYAQSKLVLLPDDNHGFGVHFGDMLKAIEDFMTK